MAFPESVNRAKIVPFKTKIGTRDVFYNMETKQDIKDLTPDRLVEWFGEHGFESWRAGQVMKWVYVRGIDTFAEMTDLSAPLRELLAEHFRVGRLKTEKIDTSQDGTRKYLFALSDATYVESVLIPEKDHYTLCVSSQVGCAQGCRFCCTARGGFTRNLTMGEIISQVRDADIRPDDPKRLTNIVFMGMGEPLLNYRNLVNAIKILADGNNGMKFSPRRITVSTSGLVPGILKLGNDTEVNLAVSLNASEDKTRGMLMPINKNYPLEKLIDACREFHLRPRKRITFEYILIKDINDSEADAKRLAKLLRRVRAKINLIPFNEFEGCDFKRPDESTVLRFQSIMKKNNYTTVIRKSKGPDINAACGQLRAKKGDHP